MRYTYDFEFLEDGKTIQPISMGMVNMDNGKELYLVFDDFDTRAVAKNRWLMDHVMSSIDHVTNVRIDFRGAPVVRDLIITDPNSVTKAEGASYLQEFVNGDNKIEWWNWYGAYDHVALCQLFGRMIDIPPRWPMYSNDIKQLHKLAGYPTMPKQPEGLHNALEDARFNVNRIKFLEWELHKKGVYPFVDYPTEGFDF